MKKLLLVLSMLIPGISVLAQDLLIYHSRSQENIKVFDRNKNLFSNEPLRHDEGKKIRIKIINPNPLFYKYELKYEEQEEKSEDKALTEALGAIGSILSTRFVQRTVDTRTLVQDSTSFQSYINILNQLMNDIDAAQTIINRSDIPELESDALNANRNSGLRYASDQVTGNVMAGEGPLVLSGSQYRFHHPNLQADLDNLLNSLANMDDGQKRIFKLVNSTLTKKVNEMKKNLREVKTELESEFTVTGKEAVIYLIIKPIDAGNSSLVRKVHTGDEKTEIARIIPNFKRAVIELVPVGNFFFSKDVKEFYLENNLVQSRLNNKTTFAPGVVLNVNVASFGKSKEMAVGLGLGYKFTDAADAFENFYFSTLFSYKAFFRIGLGAGWAQFPNELKGGGTIGQPLPQNIASLNDLVTYKEQPSAFLSIAFTGLNLTKKK